MHGNVWEWVEDCWNDSYEGAPDDGGAWTTRRLRRRVLRGGLLERSARGTSAPRAAAGSDPGEIRRSYKHYLWA